MKVTIIFIGKDTYTYKGNTLTEHKDCYPQVQPEKELVWIMSGKVDTDHVPVHFKYDDIESMQVFSDDLKSATSMIFAKERIVWLQHNKP